MNLKSIFSAIFVIFCTLSFTAQDNYNTLVFNGNKEFNKKNYESASSQYMSAAQLNDKDFTAHYNLGNSLYKRKMFEEAKAEYEKAYQRAVSFADKAAALYNLGNVHMQTNDSKKAAELYKKALKQDPRNETIRKNYEIAMLKEKEKESEKNKQNNSNGGGGNEEKDEQDKNKGQEQGNSPNNQPGNGEKKEGKENDPTKNGDDGKMPGDLEKSILDRVENKERETAKRILNKNSYSMPQSNEKDW
jgi:Ca-activated chloride channel family protein